LAFAAQGAARVRPRWEAKADIIERAARGGEMFWSGPTVFWESIKRRFVDTRSLPATAYPEELFESGLLPRSYLQYDSACVVRSLVEAFDFAQPESDTLARMIHTEFKLRLPELLLMRVDKVAMSTSVEARVPFLDHHLIEFTMGIPQTWKVRNGTTKYLLKRAVQGLIPEPTIHRRKMGFSAPMAEWIRGPFGQNVEQAILASPLIRRGFFDPSYVRRLFGLHRAHRQNNAEKIWILFNLTAWYEHWIERKAPAARYALA
jgi:asparagine synthase (glutamine-hydrolysing)